MCVCVGAWVGAYQEAIQHAVLRMLLINLQHYKSEGKHILNQYNICTPLDIKGCDFGIIQSTSGQIYS